MYLGRRLLPPIDVDNLQNYRELDSIAPRLSRAMRDKGEMKMNKNSPFNRAFTLVEILVVIGIVALLTALIFPVASNVREGARSASCASNLNQIGLALSLYVQDNNQRYPLVAQTGGLTWVDAIFPYAKSPQVFECPSAEHGEYIAGGSPNTPIILGDAGPQYGDNGSYDMVSPYLSVTTTTSPSGGTGKTYLVEPRSLSLIRYRFPSSTIIVLDGGDTTYYFHNNFAAVNPGVDTIHSVADLNDGGVFARHKGGINLLYVDGHVKWQNLESLTSTPMWRYDGREPVPTPGPSSPPIVAVR